MAVQPAGPRSLIPAGVTLTTEEVALSPESVFVCIYLCDPPDMIPNDPHEKPMPTPHRRYCPPVLWIPLVSQIIAFLSMTGCLFGPPRPDSVSTRSRLESFPADLQTRADAELIWGPHAIPTILAEDDLDVPYLMGAVHAHLRLTQMELMRRVSQGRLSELAGPPTNGIDHSIRALGLDRAVPEIEAQLPEETQDWIQRYVDGVNDHRSRWTQRPADYRLAGLGEEDWTIADVLTIGRLACVDINWGRWVSLLPLRDEAGWDEYMQRLNAFGRAGQPSFGAGEPTGLEALLDVGRTGSNCIVVSPQKSATGGALLAGDPHLGLPQPNLWCIVGYRSPSHAAVGLTFPGLPFILVGRNDHIAWGGTNMHALTSVLYRVPEEAPLTEESHRIRTRLYFDRTVSVRESEWGPVISDAPLFRKLDDGPVAMRWRGHDSSDECSAFLRASRAENWTEFREAFRTFAAGGQNMLYADDEGNIGQVLAIEFQPAAGRAGLSGPVDPSDAAYAWAAGIPSTDLPAALNPEAGYLVSANNTPVLTDPPIVGQGNTNDRVVRMRAVLDANPSVSVDDLRDLQQDVYGESSHRAAQAIVAGHDGSASDLLDAIAAWDGHYALESHGAVAYQCILGVLIERAYSERYGRKLIKRLKSAPYVHDFIREDIESGAITAETLAGAVKDAARKYDPQVTWGDIHRLHLDHPIGRVPILGRGYRFGEIPSPGSLTTIQKAGHAVSASRHSVTYGQNARHISDMTDSDANLFLILGGQDGWIGADGFLDQVGMWERGEMIRVPLRETSVRAWGEHVIQFRGTER